MQKFIALYLTVTGIGAAIALLLPSLVLFGLYLLVIPGLVLGSAPTAFLWGCIFTAFWLAAKSQFGPTGTTALIAIALTVLTVYAVTEPFRVAGGSLYRESLLPDVTPSSRIAVTGDIRIDLPAPRWDNANPRERGKQRGFSCDNLCLALLFTPGVKSVTINRSIRTIDAPRSKRVGEFDPEARTYWLVPKAQCEDRGLRPDLEGRIGLFPSSLDEGRVLNERWKSDLDDEFCLRRSAPLGRHDLLIRHHRDGAATRRNGKWSLTPRVLETEGIEIQGSAGEVLLRRLKVSVAIPSRLLAISFEGGSSDFQSGWSRSVLTNKPGSEALDLLQELEQHTNTQGR